MFSRIRKIINSRTMFTSKPVWGWLYFYQESNGPHALKEKSYTVKSKGKATSSKIVICTNDLKVPSSMINDLEKHLFTIKRELDKVYICSLCKSFVWLGGKLLQQNKKEELKHNAVISLLAPNQKLFVYVESSSAENATFPDDIKQNYTISYSLGQGGFGEVSLVFHKKTRKKYAVKKIVKKQNLLKYTKGELDILLKLDHPCVIRLQDFADEEDAMYIVLEFMDGGDLDRKIKTAIKLQTHIKESTVKLIFYQLICAVEYLHKMGVAHRDLKPANILLASDHDECLIKVTDFGISKVEDNTQLRTRLGTPHFLAPEVLKAGSRNPYTNKVDIWSMGVILFYCLELSLPFRSMEETIRGLYSFSEASKKYHSLAVDLTKKMLITEPSNRKDTRDILGHQWFKDEEMKKKAAKLMALPESKHDADLAAAKADPQKNNQEKPVLKNVHSVKPKIKPEPLKINQENQIMKNADLVKPKVKPEPLKIDKEKPVLRNKKPQAAKQEGLPSPRRVSNPEGNKFLNDTRPGQARGVLRFGSYKDSYGKNIQKETLPSPWRRESFPRATANQININDQRHMREQHTQPVHGIVEQRKHIFEKR